MKKAFFTAIAVTTFVFTCAVGSTWAQPKDCEDLLADNLYRCQVKSEFAAPGDFFEECFQFNSSMPSVSFEFDLTVVGLQPAPLGCSCEATGAFNNPHFNAAKAFNCTAPIDFVPSGNFAGQVSGNGKKITKGQIVFSDGSSFVFQCELDPTCVVGPPLSTSSAGGWR